VHEDHDILGMFSTWEYTWVSTGKGLFQIGVFVAAFLTVCYGVKLTYADRKSYPREFEDGLERELGGAGAMRVSRDLGVCESTLLTVLCRPEWRAMKTRRWLAMGRTVYMRVEASQQCQSSPFISVRSSLVG
jgi:NADH dehydrogenase (ubiquinone) 1 beta subcomplex subunit 8